MEQKRHQTGEAVNDSYWHLQLFKYSTVIP